tara:strand:- start:479 stop:883 length:405 start_codon:yes stop_codon:yes gene_type:complete
MKKSELKAYIKEEIISTLSEAEETASPKDVETQTALNAELEKTAKLRKDAGLAENEDDDVEPTAADLKKTNSLAKNASKLAANNKEMKTVVNQWKKSEGKEKENLLKRLKTLTQIKKELESLVYPSIDDDNDEM